MATRTVKYSYRAHPTPEQKQWLKEAFGAARVAFNDYIWQKERVWRGEQEEITPLSKFRTLEEEYTWMRKYPQKFIEQAVRTAETAYKNFFDSKRGKRKDRVGKPRYKQKKDRKDSVTWNGASLKTPEKYNKNWAGVYLPKHGTMLRFRLSRPLPSDPTGATLRRAPSGEYYISFTVQQEMKPKKTKGTAAGIDPGLATLASVVKDDGTRYKVENPKHYRSRQRKLSRLDQDLSRKTPGSNNYERTRFKRAKLHAEIANLRKDYVAKTAYKLASENQAVSLEDLSVATLKRNRKLSKSFSDAGLGMLKQAIKSACEREGTAFELVPAALTTQKCSVCHKIGGPKGLEGLSVRGWECSCGALLDRDYNSSTIVLLAGGHSERLNGPGGRIRRLELASSAMPVERSTRDSSPLLRRSRRSRVKSLARRAGLKASTV